MITLVLISVYIMSIIGCRWGFRMMSSKHLDKWMDEDCTMNSMWFIPFINTFLLAFLIGTIVAYFRVKPTKNKFINKLTNADLL